MLSQLFSVEYLYYSFELIFFLHANPKMYYASGFDSDAHRLF